MESTSPGIVELKIAPVPLIKAHRKLTEQMLDEIAFRKVDDAWYLTAETFGGYCHPMNREADPETGVRWNPAIYRHRYERNPKYAKLHTAFEDEIVRRGFAKTNETAAVLWHGLCMLGLEWVFSGKPLDMWFCKIYSFPFRPNWLQALFQRDSARWDKRSTNLNCNTFKAVMNRVKYFLINEDMFGVHGEHKYLAWTLEINPTRLWYKLRVKTEIAKIKNPFYYSEAIDFIGERYHDIIRLYRTYLYQIRAPKAILPYCVPKKRLAALQGEPVQMLKGDGEIPIVPVCIRSIALQGPDCVETSLETEVEGVSQMREL